MQKETIPELFPELTPWLNAAAEGRFVLPKCTGCGRSHWYPRGYCPFCYSGHIEWHEASGEGRIYAFTTVRQSAGEYVVAYVTLSEGPTILTNIVRADSNALHVDQEVRLVLGRDRGGLIRPNFTPVQSG